MTGRGWIGLCALAALACTEGKIDLEPTEDGVSSASDSEPTDPDPTDGDTDTDTDTDTDVDTDTDTDTDTDVDTDTDTDTDPVDADGDGWTADQDCDDEDASVHPEAEESFDGRDGDCDGWVDERLVCTAGGDFGSIQEGIDGVPDGATLLICAGRYAERLVVRERGLSLVGLDGSEATIVDAEAGGRALAVRSSALSVQGLSLERGATAGDGGVLLCEDSEVELRELQLKEGVAERGGLLAALGCAIELEDGELSEGLASGQGGAAYIEGGSGRLSESLFRDSEALEGGGLALEGGMVELIDSTVRDNRATTTDEWLHGHGGGGGGVWSSSAGAIVGNTVRGNRSEYNGGGIFLNYGEAEVRDNTVQENSCFEDGAGLYANQSQGDLLNNSFLGNEAEDDAGGLRIYVGAMRVEGNWFEGNLASDDGGGLKLSHSSNEVVGNRFEANRAGDAGGGAELDNDTTHLIDNEFIANEASRGAGVHSWLNEGEMNFEDLYFEGNIASSCGGGIAIDNDPHRLLLRRVVFQGNRSTDGGALCMMRFDNGEDPVYTSQVELESVLLVDNQASDEGGAIAVEQAELRIAQMTAHDNEAARGTVLAIEGDSRTEILNSIFSSNSGSAWAVSLDPVGADDAGAGRMSMRYSDVWSSGDFEGMVSPMGVDGVFAADPRYMDAAGGDYSLAPSSPCIDAGDPSLSDADGSRSDLGWTGGEAAP